jgi:hypothetical protein
VDPSPSSAFHHGTGFKRAGIRETAASAIEMHVMSMGEMTSNPLSGNANNERTSIINPAFELPHQEPSSAIETSSDISSIASTTFIWREHLQLVAIVLFTALLFEASMRRYLAGGSSFFYGWPWGLAVFCQAVALVWTLWVAIPDDMRHLCLSERSYRIAAPTFCVTMGLTIFLMACGVAERPIVSKRMREFLTCFWFFLFNAMPAYWLYTSRKALNWQASWVLLGLEAGFRVVECLHFIPIWAGWPVIVSSAGFAQVLIALLISFTIKTAFWDTALAHLSGRPLRRQAGYLCILVHVGLFLPYWCGGIMTQLLKCIAPAKWVAISSTANTTNTAGDALGSDAPFIGSRSQARLVLVLVCWSCFLVMIYLNLRLVARRCLPFARIPIILLSLQIIGDLFTGTGSPAKIDFMCESFLVLICAFAYVLKEMVFMDFDAAQWEFW